MRTRLIAGTIAACMLLTAAPVVAQEDSPVPGTSAAPAPSDGTDIVDLIPETISGMIPEISVVRGSEHFDGLDPEDDLDAQQIASLEEFVTTLGASVEDMTSIVHPRCQRGGHDLHQRRHHRRRGSLVHGWHPGRGR